VLLLFVSYVLGLIPLGVIYRDLIGVFDDLIGLIPYDKF